MKGGDLKKWLAFGTGVGIEVRGEDLGVTVARVRPREARIIGAKTILRFAQRPAAEWGAEYADFLRQCGGGHLAGTVLLPRSDVIVRQLALPGVNNRDLEAAIRYQVDPLHPYPEEEAAYAWTRVPQAAGALIGIARASLIERYALLFAEAGIRVASFTFSAAVMHAAVRLLSAPPESGFLAAQDSDGGLEIYGESPARPVFSALFDGPAENAVALAAAELRLEPGTEPVQAHEVLPAPRTAPEDYDVSRHALSYATALAGACPWLAPAANLLPAGQRSSSSRAVFVPTIVLAGLLVIAVALLAAQGSMASRRYQAGLEAEIARLSPQAGKVEKLDASVAALRARRQVLDEFRLRSREDLDALLELTRILPPPAWVQSLQMTRANLLITGEAEQSAPLLKVIDSSPLYRDSEFTLPMARVQGGETFAIRAVRESGPAGGGR